MECWNLGPSTGNHVRGEKMNREEKVNFIIENHPEFSLDTPQEWKDKLKEELQQLDDEELERELEWVMYLMDK